MARIRFEDVPHDKPAGKGGGGRGALREKKTDLADPQQGNVDEEASRASGSNDTGAEIVEPADPVASGKKKRTKPAKPA
jgi:hypothetical protein